MGKEIKENRENKEVKKITKLTKLLNLPKFINQPTTLFHVRVVLICRRLRDCPGWDILDVFPIRPLD